jgi:hypothetical protein
MRLRGFRGSVRPKFTWALLRLADQGLSESLLPGIGTVQARLRYETYSGRMARSAATSATLSHDGLTARSTGRDNIGSNANYTNSACDGFIDAVQTKTKRVDTGSRPIRAIVNAGLGPDAAWNGPCEAHSAPISSRSSARSTAWPADWYAMYREETRSFLNSGVHTKEVDD